MRYVSFHMLLPLFYVSVCSMYTACFEEGLLSISAQANRLTICVYTITVMRMGSFAVHSIHVSSYEFDTFEVQCNTARCLPTVLDLFFLSKHTRQKGLITRRYHLLIHRSALAHAHTKQKGELGFEEK